MTKRIIFPILCTLSCLLTLMACLEEKDPLNYSPNVATGTATDIGYTNATLSGTIRQNTGTHIADGGILLSERSDMEAYTKLEVTASAYSSFTTVADNLTPGTTYYYCAYASSGYSMVRGEIKSFTNRVGGKRSSFLPTFVFRPLTPPYVPFGIRRFLSTDAI